MGTLDARLIALDRINGEVLWNAEVGDVALANSVTMAPLAVKDKVIVGVGGGEFGIRGYVAAYYADTGEQAWKTYTIPGPGEPGHDSWQDDDWMHGGAPVWITGSFDAEQNQVYWGSVIPGLTGTTNSAPVTIFTLTRLSRWMSIRANWNGIFNSRRMTPTTMTPFRCRCSRILIGTVRQRR